MERTRSHAIALGTWAIPHRSSSMGAPRISVFLWRLDALQERAARARHAWLQAKAVSDERRLLLTDTKGIWPQKLDKWLRLNRPGGSR